MNKCNNCQELVVNAGTLKLVHGNTERVIAVFCAKCQIADRLIIELTVDTDGPKLDSYQPRQSNFGK